VTGDGDLATEAVARGSVHALPERRRRCDDGDESRKRESHAAEFPASSKEPANAV